MRFVNKNEWVDFVSLDKSMIQSNPNTKDKFTYIVMTLKYIEVRYKLILTDDCSNIFGELQAQATLTSNTKLTSFDIDQYLCELTVWGRQVFNKEAMKYHINMYIPKAEELYVHGKIKAA